MTQPLAILEQKFKPPQQWVKLTQRQSLLTMLHERQHARLTTLVSPAGFGKSTLLAQYLSLLEQQAATKVIWISLDPSDNQANQFINLLSHAFFYAGLVDQSFITQINSLSASRDDDTWSQKLLSAIIKNKQRVYLFFDDFHFISDPIVINLINTLLRYNIVNLHIVISSRLHPDLATSHLLVSGQLLSIDAQQLKFSMAECTALLQDICSKQQIEELYVRTEGWPVALQLILLWHQQNPDGNLAQLIYNNTETLNSYMAQQIFAALSDETQSFLLRTSFLDRFNIELANYVCDIDNSHQILQQLRGHHSLIIPLDQTHGSFRYHHLFSDFLQLTLLEKIGEQRCNELRCRAALYFSEKKHLHQAISQCLRAKSPDLAIELVSQAHGWEIILNRGIGYAESILAQFEQAQITNSPLLGLMQCYLSIKLGNMEQAEQQLTIAKAIHIELKKKYGKSDAQDRDFLLMETLNEIYLDHAISPSTIDTLHKNLHKLAPTDHLGRGIFSACLALMHNQLAQFEQAQSAAQLSEQEMQLANCWIGLNYSLIHHGQALAYRGLLQPALEQFKQASTLAEKHLGLDNGLKSMTTCLMAELYYQQHQHDQAKQLLDQEIAILEQKDCWHDIYAVCFKLAINLAIIEDNHVLAQQYLLRGYQVAHSRNLSRLNKHLDVLKLKISVAFDDIEQFNQSNSIIIRESYWQDTLAMWQVISEYYWVMSLHYLKRNMGNQCQNYCNKLFELADKTQQNTYLVRVFGVRALIFWQEKKHDKAMHYLISATNIAVSHGIITVFFELPSCIMQPLKHLKQQSSVLKLSNQHIELIDFILQKSQLQARSEFDKLGLSQREQEIAPHLLTGMTNKQISAQLGITDNTVKFHLKNMFTKLTVSNRNEAMAVLVALLSTNPIHK